MGKGECLAMLAMTYVKRSPRDIIKSMTLKQGGWKWQIMSGAISKAIGSPLSGG